MALAVGLVLCEGLLRAAAWTNRALHRREVHAGEAERVWACIGDSNTYGVFEDDDDTYPAALERLLGTHAERGPERVLNLGLPGVNARQADTILARALAERRPELVLLLVGANNVWSWHAADDLDYGEPPWYEELRLVRLARLFAFAVAERGEEGPVGPPAPSIDRLANAPGAPGEAQTVAGFDREGHPVRFLADTTAPAPPQDALARSIRADMSRLQERLDAAAQPYCFLTYAYDQGDVGRINDAIRAAAAELGAPLVDAGRRLAPARAAFAPERLFYPDSHLRALGYDLYARAVYEGLRELALVRGAAIELLESARREDPPAPAPSLRWREGEALPDLVIDSGDPGRPYLVVVSGDAGERPAQHAGLPLPVFDDPFFRGCYESPLLIGTTDAEGRALVDFRALPHDAGPLRGRRLRAAYVLYQSARHAQVRTVSAAVAFTVR